MYLTPLWTVHSALFLHYYKPACCSLDSFYCIYYSFVSVHTLMVTRRTFCVLVCLFYKLKNVDFMSALKGTHSSLGYAPRKFCASMCCILIHFNASVFALFVAFFCKDVLNLIKIKLCWGRGTNAHVLNTDGVMSPASPRNLWLCLGYKIKYIFSFWFNAHSVHMLIFKYMYMHICNCLHCGKMLNCNYVVQWQ